LATALVGRIVPAGKEHMHPAAIHCDLALDLQPHSSGSLRGVEPQVRAVRRPGDSANVSTDSDQFMTLATIGFGNEQVTQAGVGQKGSIGRPRGGFGNEVPDFAWCVAQYGNVAKRFFRWSTLPFDQQNLRSIR